ncbi:ubiquitin thioesterase otulin isoform X2 [Xenopus laevis]|uniref:Ubiquitin thioesterase otulin isoform X2 n=1 Tax=Xenopus laevis TaxID=8355 RepID=A0A8J0VN20_XENLA|nr:ubiquitin thioesterase otulin isoform X2 [Xenopus laevis]
MGCLWSLCCSKTCHCWHRHIGKQSRSGKSIFCCAKKKKKRSEKWTVNDSFLMRQSVEDADFQSIICTPEKNDSLKVEVSSSIECSQQLEPEILNCAAELSLYQRPGCRVIHEELPGLPEKNIGIQNLFASDDRTSSAEMEPLPKRTPHDCSSAGDKERNMSHLSEHKRSKLLYDPQERSSGNQVLIAHTRSTSLELIPSEKLQSDPIQPPCEVDESTGANGGKKDFTDLSSQIDTDNSTSTENSILDASQDLNILRKIHKTKNVKEQLITSQLEKETPLSLDNEEDLYRDEEDIEKDKSKIVPAATEGIVAGDHKLGVGPEMDIVEYCKKEWRGKTAVAQIMKKGYEQVSRSFVSIRRVRGDNYCALRATLFQALSQTAKLPEWLDDAKLYQLPEKFSTKYEWIKLWRFWNVHGDKNVGIRLKEYVELLKEKWAALSSMKTPEERQAACNEIFTTEGEEYCLYEGVKFLMLKTAVDLYKANEERMEVPVFSWLLFARNTSSNPCEFMKNHLNQVGHSAGLEQVEMFLLGYALQHTIKVYRLYKCGTDEFITYYPNDQTNWPIVTLITEDDRHYNVPVRVCEETSV